MNKHQFFTENLLDWFSRNHRPLPWKGERDPYIIWLSEIILQQTRAEQGLPYFQKFVEHYPTVRQLADAAEDEVMKMWQGLGYYTRARNLHSTAKFVANELGGNFPNSIEGIRNLKGVGDYTAAAIASFAFGLSHAVVDGNVFRVLARYFGIEKPTDTPAAKREFSTLANDLLDPTRPADFNQAIMDFGATHCTPRNPKCEGCPLATACSAHLYNMVSVLPVKSKKMERRTRYFLYAVFQTGAETFIRKRTGRDIWQDLYEFPMLELAAIPADRDEIIDLISINFFEGKKSDFELGKISKPYSQILTHQTVIAVFCEIRLKNNLLVEPNINVPFNSFIRVNQIRLKKMFAVPHLVDSYLQDESLLLSLF